jgi:hypothetical protein
MVWTIQGFSGRPTKNQAFEKHWGLPLTKLTKVHDFWFLSVLTVPNWPHVEMLLMRVQSKMQPDADIRSKPHFVFSTQGDYSSSDIPGSQPLLADKPVFNGWPHSNCACSEGSLGVRSGKKKD